MIYYAAILTFLLMTFLIAFLGDEKEYKKSFALWICTFALGYRTLTVSYHLKIHPSEVILWLLFILFLLRKNSMKPEKKSIQPKFLVALIPFFIWGWIVGIMRGREWDLMFSEFKNFLILFPMIHVTAHILEDKEKWRGVLAAFYGVSTFIATVGILEYVFPEIKSFLPLDIPTEKGMLAEGGFVRATFDFWGSEAATLICVLALPMFYFVKQGCDKPRQKLLVHISLVLLFVGIYIGGYRSMWFLTAIMILAFSLKRFGLSKSLVILPIIFLIFLNLMPQIGKERFESLFLAFRGRSAETVDTSSLKRRGRAEDAIETMLKHPLGIGWAGAGWVHSDFLQVAVNLGLAAGMIFLLWYMRTLKSLWRSCKLEPKNSVYDPLGISLLLSFIGAGGILVMEGVQVLPQLVLPVWFVWCLAEVHLRKLEKI